MRTLFRGLFIFLLVTCAFVGAVCLAAWLVRPNLKPQAHPYTPEQLAQAKADRDVAFDPKNTPSLYRHEFVRPRQESPLLADLVSQKKLPVLAERMPEEPAVMQGPEGVGVYGGTWMRIANSPGDVDITYRICGDTLVRWSPLGYPIEMHIAKAVTASADDRVWTVTLRRGMKWSDGHPYTADDIMYWWECEANNPLLTRISGGFMRMGGKVGTVEKVDDFTVRFTFPEPNATFLERLTKIRELTNLPAHYLRQYHPDPAIGNRELIKREMQAYKLPSDRALYSFMKSTFNPEHPRLWPWLFRTYKSNPPQVFVRNPYYFAVDPEGNQLPYVDRLQFEVLDAKMLALTAANGGVSMQGRHIRFSDYTELMSRREVAGTHVLHWYPSIRSTYVINPNLNRRVDPDDPATLWKSKLLSDKRFRQALSLAINRQQIITADYNGIGEPAQVAPGPESKFHHEGVARAYVAYDPDRVNALLDEIGLAKRDSEGYRTFPDGSRMTFYLDFTAFTGVGPAQFVLDDWGKVGVRTVIRERTRPLFYAEKEALIFDFNVWTSESDLMPLQQPRYFVATSTESNYAIGWGKWFSRGGFYGAPEAVGKGCVPVPKDSPMYEAMACYEAANRTTSLDEQKKYMDRIFDITAENVWSIGIASSPPQLIVVRNGFRNVSRNALWGDLFCSPANTCPETYYFEKPQDSPGAIAATKLAILQPTLRPGAEQDGNSFTARCIRYSIWAIVAISVFLICRRAPYIMRRLLIMIPTLFIISIIVFTIIQLPPGDFLSTRIMQLEESGDPADMRAIDDLRQQFHFDESAPVRYLRWVGLKWFTSFNARDEGLLQGNMGRSMETTQPVNNMVGDRIVLTVLLSLGTILFTWFTALPIGIYSAVRQYSISDYALTLFGFVGMCVPSFLLALILMAISGISGLFSPEYAAQPEWSWLKFLDLLKHIWIPVVVLGIGGTAGMIRVMRANLLDELRKPYVVTAMAKGVRPMKLLLKYPVRLALNPFISSIGHLFPALVSGGAIVSMVLALPMVGPLLLQALFSQDMYLAGSMLMVLSLLGVLGTLVSDLLLLWLDPRIRYEGGSR